MEASISSNVIGFRIWNPLSRNGPAMPRGSLSANVQFHCSKSSSYGLIGTHSLKTRVSSISDVPAVVDPVQAEITWQIVVGAIAGVTPFIVAGIEFSKRIIAQKNCEVCGGSGLVLSENKSYYRCPGCGKISKLFVAFPVIIIFCRDLI